MRSLWGWKDRHPERNAHGHVTSTATSLTDLGFEDAKNESKGLQVIHTHDGRISRYTPVASSIQEFLNLGIYIGPYRDLDSSPHTSLLDHLKALHWSLNRQSRQSRDLHSIDPVIHHLVILPGNLQALRRNLHKHIGL